MLVEQNNSNKYILIFFSRTGSIFVSLKKVYDSLYSYLLTIKKDIKIKTLEINLLSVKEIEVFLVLNNEIKERKILDELRQHIFNYLENSFLISINSIIIGFNKNGN